MQYANILVDHKASYKPLTYAIPAPLLAHLHIGSIVRVPIGPKQYPGVVVQFLNRLDGSLALKLKPIHSMVYGFPYVPIYLLKAMYDLHHEYGIGSNELLFSFLPPIPKKRQADSEVSISPGSDYQVFEYIISTADRVEAYRKIIDKALNQNLSLLILCPSASSVLALTQLLKQHQLPVQTVPKTDKELKRFYLSQLSNPQSTVTIGTRGGKVTPLNHYFGVIIDEPWLPGHKEEHSPKLWSALAMQSLCKAQNIPLYLFSSLPWPETQLISSKRFIVKSTFGKVYLAPRRNSKELLTQFFADYDGKTKHLAIVLRESNQQMYWCEHCKQSTGMSGLCVTCGRMPIMLPKLSKESIEQEIQILKYKAHVTIVTSESLIHYHIYDAALVLGFDVFLSIVDFRVTNYLASLLYILGAEAKETLFATNHPDEWTKIMHKDLNFFLKTEIEARKKHHLPPFGMPVQLTAKDKTTLESLKFDSAIVLQVGTIRQEKDIYRISLLTKLHTPLPPEWFKKANLKVDILPSYID